MTAAACRTAPRAHIRAPSDAITPERLRELLDYEPSTGRLTWRVRSGEDGLTRRFNATWAGRPALASKTRDGYQAGGLLGLKLLAHRVCYAIAHGRWPSQFIDHINGDRSDNRIFNLRECSRLQNNCNSRSFGKCGFKGVSTDKGRWRARIGVSGRKMRFLGLHDTPEAAARAYDRAARELWGDFAKLNFPDEALPQSLDLIQPTPPVPSPSGQGVANSGTAPFEVARNAAAVPAPSFHEALISAEAPHDHA